MKRYSMMYRVVVDMVCTIEANSLVEALSGPPPKIGDLIKRADASYVPIPFDNWTIRCTGVVDPAYHTAFQNPGSVYGGDESELSIEGA